MTPVMTKATHLVGAIPIPSTRMIMTKAIRTAMTKVIAPPNLNMRTIFQTDMTVVTVTDIGMASTTHLRTRQIIGIHHLLLTD